MSCWRTYVALYRHNSRGRRGLQGILPAQVRVEAVGQRRCTALKSWGLGCSPRHLSATFISGIRGGLSARDRKPDPIPLAVCGKLFDLPPP